MYSREFGDGDVVSAPRQFGVSGKLWHGVLVMYDRENGSLWTQLDGRAIQGPDTGRRLEHVSSVFTTWEAWKRLHPQTLVLAKTGGDREHRGSRYADYFADPERLMFPHLAEGIGGIGPKDVVFGTVVGNEAAAISARLLSRAKIVNAVVGHTPVAWIYDDETDSAIVVESRVMDRIFVLEPIQEESPLVFFRDTLTGDRLATDTLSRLRMNRSYWYAWARSHAGSSILCD